MAIDGDISKGDILSSLDITFKLADNHIHQFNSMARITGIPCDVCRVYPRVNTYTLYIFHYSMTYSEKKNSKHYFTYMDFSCMEYKICVYKYII